MSLLHQSYKTDENLPRWIVIIRLVLGASLIFKASMFFNNSQELTNYFQETAILKNFTWAIPVVPWVHIVVAYSLLSACLPASLPCCNCPY